MHNSTLPAGFFDRSADVVARDLIGKTLLSRVGHEPIEVVVVGTEAFEDGAEGGDIRKGMLYAPGTMFVMSHRGHLYFNIATGKVDEASCVMVRAVLLRKELLEGPGRVSKRLQLAESLDGKQLGIGVDILANDLQPPMVNRDTTAADRAKNSTARYQADPRWIAYQQSLA